jgi:hypothetical protein
MKNFKEYLAESNYQYAGGDQGMDDAEYERRLKLFGYDHGGAAEFQIPYKDLWTGEEGWSTGYTRQQSLVNPDYKYMDAAIDFRDPATIRGNIESVKKNPEHWGGRDPRFSVTGMASGRIAELTQALKDAEHYQKIKSQIPQLLKQSPASGQPATPGKSKPGKTLLPFDQKVKDIQDRILAKDPKALPRFGADGRMGKETQAAMARLGIKESLELQRILDISKF